MLLVARVFVYITGYLTSMLNTSTYTLCTHKPCTHIHGCNYAHTQVGQFAPHSYTPHSCTTGIHCLLIHSPFVYSIHTMYAVQNFRHVSPAMYIVIVILMHCKYKIVCFFTALYYTSPFDILISFVYA